MRHWAEYEFILPDGSCRHEMIDLTQPVRAADLELQADILRRARVASGAGGAAGGLSRRAHRKAEKRSRCATGKCRTRAGAQSNVSDVAGSDWSAGEIDLIVADYFAMLHDELSGRTYVKAAHNEALQRLIGRSRGSIEFKHQNISAVLVRLGMRWIRGYKPMANFQGALIEGIGRYLAARPEQLSSFPEQGQSAVAESAELWIGPPPTLTPADREETPALRRLVRQFDPAERDARNRKLGEEGEAIVLQHERRRLAAEGRADLAGKVEWTSKERGDGAEYDIRSFFHDGRERLIEVKTTAGAASTPFFISENERAFSDERPGAFRLLRLYNVLDRPAAFELAPPLSEQLKLNPTNFRAVII